MLGGGCVWRTCIIGWIIIVTRSCNGVKVDALRRIPLSAMLFI